MPSPLSTVVPDAALRTLRGMASKLHHIAVTHQSIYFGVYLSWYCGPPLSTVVPDAALRTLRGMASRLGRSSRLPGRCCPDAAATCSHCRRCMQEANDNTQQTVYCVQVILVNMR
jgi:hypothetical protein